MAENGSRYWPGSSGEMVERIRAHDWAATPLGSIEGWPQSLKSVVDLMLCSSQPASIAFGPALTILYNDAYIPILGTKHPKSLGQPYSCVWSELWLRFKPAIEATMAGEAQHVTDHRVAISDHSTMWFTCSWTPLRDEAGLAKGFYCSATDTTAQVLAQTALRESEERLRFCLRGAGAAAWQWDFLTRKQVWSPESYELHGRDPELGAPSYEEWLQCLHPDDRARVEKVVSDAVAAKSPEYRTEYRVVLPSGKVRWLGALGKVDYAADGSPLRISGINLDITERKRAEEALRESDERLRFCLKGAGAAAWQWEIPADRMVWSPESHELYGHASDSSMPQRYEPWLRSVHPDDRERVEKAVFDAIGKRSREYKAEYRIRRPSGEVRWLDALGKVECAADGRLLRMSGISRDITERKRAEVALEHAAKLQRQKVEELEAILAAIPAVLVIAKDARCIEMSGNQAAHDFLRLSPKMDLSKSASPERAPKNFEVFSNGRRLSPDELPIQRAAAEKKAILAQELEIRFKEGDAKVVLANALPLFDDMGAVRGAVGALADITDLKRTEAALRESEERLNFALDAANAGTWEVALETGELSASDRALLFIGIAPGTPVTYELVLARVHPDDQSRLEEALRHTLETGEPYRLEWRAPLADGSVRWLETRGELRSVSGKQVIAGLVLDVTDRKRAEEALRESEQRLKFALEAANAGTGEVVLDTGEIFASERAIALMGLPEGTPLTAEMTLTGMPAEDRVRVARALGHTLQTGEPYRLETQLPLPDGSVRWVETRGELRSVSGKRVISGLVQDITERKQAELALRESEEMLRTVVEHVPVPILVSRQDRKILFVNPALTQLTGYTLADIPTRDEWEAYAYRERARYVREAICDAFERGAPVERGELWVHTKSGERRLWSIKAAPAGRDVSGQRIMVCVGLDITERKRSEDEARASSSKLEAALASMADAVIISDAEGRFVHFNEAFVKFHRFKSTQDCLKTFAEHPAFLSFFLPGGEPVPPEEWPSQRALRGETGMLVEYVIKRLDGETYVGSYNFAPIRDRNGDITGAVVTACDITDRKRAERQLRESEARLSSIIDTAADSIIILDEKDVIQSVNRATANIFGYSPKELIGQHVSLLMPPEVRKRRERYLSAFSGAGGIEKMEARRKDGSLVPLDVGLAEWRDGEGKRFFTGILRDLSERKRSEEALAAALRLEAVGQLAGGVAHDFNNLLAVIAGNLELAGDRITDEIARDLIHRALNAAEKGSGLNRRLLFLARKRTLTPQQRLNLNACVEDIAKLLKTTLGELIEVGAELAAGLWMTVADPAEIDSAILNITTNARDAMPHGGRLRISTGNVMIDAPAAATLHPDARPGEYVRLVLADNGVGMSQDVLGKAMEPFFTTKGPGTGTGLGLASVASFARQTGGFITLESAPGCGCAVSLYLPRAAEDLPVLKTDDDDLPLGDGELVLVVEDDDQVREVTLKRIESLGYAVAEARTGPEAVQRLKSEEPVELVLSDIVMPGGMTGYDVARWVTSNRPGIQIILCSGHHDEDLGSDVRTPIRDVIVLGKPYSREQLARALSNALAVARMSGGHEILLQEL